MSELRRIRYVERVREATRALFEDLLEANRRLGLAISVHIQGPAIPATAQAALFEPMVRGTATGTAARGVGLGLFIVRVIA